jgi:hypothetical protein
MKLQLPLLSDRDLLSAGVVNEKKQELQRQGSQAGAWEPAKAPALNQLITKFFGNFLPQQETNL